MTGDHQRWNIVPAGDLDLDDASLLVAAQTAERNARPRFSGFSVGAALRIEGSAQIYSGWNVEDQSLSKVLHAEQAAMFAAINQQVSEIKIMAIAVWGVGDVPPCGTCRQMIVDSNPEARVLFPYDGGILVTTARELIPLQFRLSQ